ncbi:hypothetical protein [Ferruginibacter sp.]|nr:hypothetical protein [Ferruginibacter sp.]MBC7627913.1 hypothetical protein [Ferruginibacter sp.]
MEYLSSGRWSQRPRRLAGVEVIINLSMANENSIFRRLTGDAPTEQI